MNSQQLKRLNAIIFFSNKHEGKIERLKLMKLLWLADRIHLNKYGRFILKDSYYALPNGPIPSDTLDISQKTVAEFHSVSDKFITSDRTFDEQYFSKSDIEIMNLVWNKFGGYTAYYLRDFSHLFPEWKRFEEQLNHPNTKKGYPMVVEDFFISPENINMSQFYSEEETKLSRSHFLEHHKTQTALNDL